MKCPHCAIAMVIAVVSITLRFSESCAQDATKIVIVAGETAKQDTMGHHDYIAGCKCMQALLQQTKNVQSVIVMEGWPAEEAVFKDARSIVFYTDGGGKQAFLSDQSRIDRMQRLMDSKVGLVLIHQAVDFPEANAKQAIRWAGGAYLPGSGRGHWDSKHTEFPPHAITRGVEPWEINDGWLNGLHFADEMKGVTPLVWSGKKYLGSRAGLDPDIVGFAFDRQDGGRSFSFTGLDAHSAWSLKGMRQLMINGVLWTAGIEIPSTGAPCEISDDALKTMMTPREPKPKKK